MLDDEPRGAIQLIEGHSDLLQRSRSADADREVKNALCSVLTAGQAECAAEDMTDVVVNVAGWS